ncbi:MAG: hypothetical protein ACKN82_10385, partial [Pirellula sp.]
MVKTSLFVASLVGLWIMFGPVPAMVCSQETQWAQGDLTQGDLAKELHAILARQQIAWNRGDIPN